MTKSRDRLALLRGTLDVMVLRSVTARPLHGFDISLWLEDKSGGTFVIDDSALYQALHRLEARGLVRGTWGISDNNRRARFYALTAQGRAHLAGESKRLVSYARAITALLGVTRE